MSQITLRANLLAKDFPFAAQYQGNTVLFGQYDQKASTVADGRDNDAMPEAIYMQNVLPTAYGYKSVTYKKIADALPAGAGNVVQLVTLRDSDEPNDKDRGYLAITDTARTYLISTLATRWIDVTPTDQPICDVTVATVGGWSYIFYANWKMFLVDMDLNLLVEMTLTGLSVPITRIVGVTASNNYLIMHDGFTVYWSNPLNALDFTPSLITGAGSEIPATLSGLIKAVYPVSTGFAIYSTINIVISLFSGNSRYPWIFKEANNSSGINAISDVAPGGDGGTNYALTSGGLLQVSLSGCTQVLPAVYDFLVSGNYEFWDSIQGIFQITKSAERHKVRLAYVGARYLLISYGFSHSLLIFTIVYDTALKRFGKLRGYHVSMFEFAMDFAGSVVPWNDKTLTTWNDPVFIDRGWDSLRRLSTDAAVPGHSVARIASDGTISLVMVDAIEAVDPVPVPEEDLAVVVLGKYQLARNLVTTLQEVDIESINSLIGDVRVQHGISVDGNSPHTFADLVPAPNSYSPVLLGGSNRIYPCRRTGLTHMIAVSGTFHLVSLLLRFSKAGRR